MEAIQPGSSPSTYESPFTKDDSHSYKNLEVPESHDQPPPKSSATVICDKRAIATTMPDTADSYRSQAQDPESSPAEAAHEYEPIPMSPTSTGSTSPLTQLQPETLQSNKEDSDGDDDGRIYSNIQEELGQEDLYAEIDQTDLLAPNEFEGATIEEDTLDSIKEDTLDPNKMQLWLLLQIQKMVQKMEDVYGAAQPLSPNADLESAKPQHKAKPPPPPSSLDSPSEAIIQKEIIKEDTCTQSETIRQELYLNQDTVNETATESPIPPKTHQVIHRCGSRESVSKPESPAPPASDQQPWSNTPPPRRHPRPSPVQAKDQVRHDQHQIKLRAGKNIYNNIMLLTCTAGIIHNVFFNTI
jgi:hypothetical protein